MRPLTANQRAARAQIARKLTCPRCGRGAALSSRYELRDSSGRRVGSARRCRYCDHETGVRDGRSFGRHAPPDSLNA